MFGRDSAGLGFVLVCECEVGVFCRWQLYQVSGIIFEGGILHLKLVSMEEL